MAMVPFKEAAATLDGIVAVIIAALQEPREVLLVAENTGPDAATIEVRTASSPTATFETYGIVSPDLTAIPSGGQVTVLIPRNRLSFLQVRGQSDGTSSVVTVKLYHAPGAVGPVNGRI